MSLPKKIAIVGANGFVGSRLIELFHLSGVCEVLPVVRGVGGLPRLSRFELNWRFADARSAESLAKALAGCDSVVHSVVGDSKVIEAVSKALIPAATKAGVRRIVYLSTASVHGQNPAPGTNEDSPLNVCQAVAYNNAKVQAERILLSAWKGCGVELVMLRPSIVFGPRDRWITTLVHELRSKLAWLIREGAGICNSIYVDNLVHAIHLALEAPQEKVNGQAFLVGDAETVTWKDVYSAVADRLKVPFEQVHRIDEPHFPSPGFSSKLGALKSTAAVQAMLPIIPSRLKRGVNGFINAWREPAVSDPWQLPVLPKPSSSYEMVELQKCSYRFPQERARLALDYHAPVSFEEGLNRTLGWLEWSSHIRAACK